jgi:hypothetical protein
MAGTAGRPAALVKSQSKAISAREPVGIASPRDGSLTGAARIFFIQVIAQFHARG